MYLLYNMSYPCLMQYSWLYLSNIAAASQGVKKCENVLYLSQFSTKFLHLRLNFRLQNMLYPMVKSIYYSIISLPFPSKLSSLLCPTALHHCCSFDYWFFWVVHTIIYSYINGICIWKPIYVIGAICWGLLNGYNCCLSRSKLHYNSVSFPPNLIILEPIWN